MIIASISGGLGNQLFQYSAAKALAVHHNVPLKLDTSYYDADKKSTPRSFELFNFNIVADIASENELAPFKKVGVLQKVFQRSLPFYKRKPFKEPYFHFYKDFFKAPSTTYLKGTWQSEKYFKTIKDTLEKEITVLPEFVEYLQEKAEALSNENSVSVHIRRGDYLNPIFMQHHGVLTKDYYKQSINTIQQKYSSCKFYFFSDDIEWVKDNVIIEQPVEFVTGFTTQNHLQDFYLMQHCKHNIIANSSFSWWAAWLNTNFEKTVIAPRQWFNKANYNTNDLLPAEWIKV